MATHGLARHLMAHRAYNNDNMLGNGLERAMGCAHNTNNMLEFAFVRLNLQCLDVVVVMMVAEL
jgi:hypothetical protein